MAADLFFVLLLLLPRSLSLSTLSLLRPVTSPVSLFSPSAGGLAGGNVGFLSPLFFPYFHAFWTSKAKRIFAILRSILHEFEHEIYGFWWGECVEHDRNLQIDFWTSFDRRVFSSELFFDDSEWLVRFLKKWRLDLDSLGDFEWNSMVEIIG